MPQQFDFPKNPIQQLRFSPRTVYLVLAVLATLWVLSGIYTVDPDEKAVILRFGKLHAVVDPGLHYHLPRPIEMNIIRSTTRVYREEIGFQTIDPGPPARYRQRPKESLMLTGDENIVNVEMVVQYKVSSVTDALFHVRGLGAFEGSNQGLIHDACEASLRQVVGRHGIDEVLTEGKLRVQTEIKEKLQELFDIYRCGLTVQTVQLQSVGPPQQVDAAFKDVASAKEDRERLVNEARGYQNDVIPKARGEAERMLKEAEAYTVERVRRAQGDADRFGAVYAEYVKAPEVTERRLYIETMERILPKMQKYIIDADGKGVINLINLERLMSAPAR
ncbi:MAG TPA: FtsH protease activity modulator HflK [Candidatus Latescibacteria bacterium]|nr:FtsH protease activity modulator HflK [Candidatus Latescibacterota bacterium]